LAGTPSRHSPDTPLPRPCPSYLLLSDSTEVCLWQAHLPVTAWVHLYPVRVLCPVPRHPVVPEEILAWSAVGVPVAAVVVLEVVVVVLEVVVSEIKSKGEDERKHVRSRDNACTARIAVLGCMYMNMGY